MDRRILNAGENGPLPMSPQAARLKDADEQEFLSGPQCKDCKHWRKLPPTREPMTGAQDMSKPVMGQCRRRLVSASIMGQTPNGPQLMGHASGYPTTPPDFCACGDYEEKPVQIKVETEA